MSAKDLKERNETGAYILVDFDRTLARYESWSKSGDTLGKPIPAMVERVQRWLHTGMDVRLFTARASRNDADETKRIQAWCLKHLGRAIPIQNWKCFKCIAIWDDLAISVESNTGYRTTINTKEGIDPLSHDEELELVKIANPRTQT